MKVTIIAEAGVNHNGNIVRARKLINIAKNCNADYVKFQSFKVEDLLLKKTKKILLEKRYKFSFNCF